MIYISLFFVLLFVVSQIDYGLLLFSITPHMMIHNILADRCLRFSTLCLDIKNSVILPYCTISRILFVLPITINGVTIIIVLFSVGRLVHIWITDKQLLLNALLDRIVAELYPNYEVQYIIFPDSNVLTTSVYADAVTSAIYRDGDLYVEFDDTYCITKFNIGAVQHHTGFCNHAIIHSEHSLPMPDDRMLTTAMIRRKVLGIISHIKNIPVISYKLFIQQYDEVNKTYHEIEYFHILYDLNLTTIMEINQGTYNFPTNVSIHDYKEYIIKEENNIGRYRVIYDALGHTFHVDAYINTGVQRVRRVLNIPVPRENYVGSVLLSANYDGEYSFMHFDNRGISITTSCTMLYG